MFPHNRSSRSIAREATPSEHDPVSGGTNHPKTGTKRRAAGLSAYGGAGILLSGGTLIDTDNPMNMERRNGYVTTILRQRCPHCRRGIVYRRPMSMNNRCPACGARFDREPGYFTGAIYVGTAVTAPLGIGFFYLAALLFPDLHLALCGLVGAAAVVPLVPLVLRLSRVFWLDIGHQFSPQGNRTDPPPPEHPAAGAPTDPIPTDGCEAGEIESRYGIEPKTLLTRYDPAGHLE